MIASPPQELRALPTSLSITFTKEGGRMIGKFLQEERDKRRLIDSDFSTRAWAEEIGVPHASLSRWMNDSDEGVSISFDNLTTLIEYFGQSFVDALPKSIIPPSKPRNPFHGKTLEDVVKEYRRKR